MASNQVHRITLFKVPSENVQKMEALYSDLVNTQSKDGKPYILSIFAGPTTPDQRSQGWNFCCKTTFASAEDMKYYDDVCPAHQKMKASAKSEGLTTGPPMTVYYSPTIIGGSDA